jgi:serine/threonine protein kinase
MAPAKGKDLKTLVEKGELNETQKKQFLRSTLHSLKGLNERGFVHCDIKPDNTFFDKKNGITTLIDTGMLFKRSKNQEKHGGTQYVEGYENQGTMPYMHPRLLDGKNHGTERDLWAVGLMALKVHNPVAYDHFIENKRNMPESLLSESWLQDELDRQIEQAEPGKVKKALEALRRDIENGDTIAGFAKQCFDKALLPAEDWNDLDFAQTTYDELMGHPGLR